MSWVLDLMKDREEAAPAQPVSGPPAPAPATPYNDRTVEEETGESNPLLQRFMSSIQADTGFEMSGGKSAVYSIAPFGGIIARNRAASMEKSLVKAINEGKAGGYGENDYVFGNAVDRELHKVYNEALEEQGSRKKNILISNETGEEVDPRSVSPDEIGDSKKYFWHSVYSNAPRTEAEAEAYAREAMRERARHMLNYMNRSKMRGAGLHEKAKEEERDSSGTAFWGNLAETSAGVLQFAGELYAAGGLGKAAFGKLPIFARANAAVAQAARAGKTASFGARVAAGAQHVLGVEMMNAPAVFDRLRTGELARNEDGTYVYDDQTGNVRFAGHMVEDAAAPGGMRFVETGAPDGFFKAIAKTAGTVAAHTAVWSAVGPLVRSTFGKPVGWAAKKILPESTMASLDRFFSAVGQMSVYSQAYGIPADMAKAYLTGAVDNVAGLALPGSQKQTWGEYTSQYADHAGETFLQFTLFNVLGGAQNYFRHRAATKALRQRIDNILDYATENMYGKSYDWRQLSRDEQRAVFAALNPGYRALLGLDAKDILRQFGMKKDAVANMEDIEATRLVSAISGLGGKAPDEILSQISNNVDLTLRKLKGISFSGGNEMTPDELAQYSQGFVVPKAEDGTPAWQIEGDGLRSLTIATGNPDRRGLGFIRIINHEDTVAGRRYEVRIPGKAAEFTGDEAAALTLAKTRYAEARRAVDTRKSKRKLAEQFAIQNGVASDKLRIYDSAEDLVRENPGIKDYDADACGVTLPDGRYAVVLDNAISPVDLIITLKHEGFHSALKQLARAGGNPDTVRSVMRALLKSIREGRAPERLAKEYERQKAKEYSTLQGEDALLEYVEEALAEIASTPNLDSVKGRVNAQILRNSLMALGMGRAETLRLSDADLIHMLRETMREADTETRRAAETAPKREVDGYEAVKARVASDRRVADERRATDEAFRLAREEDRQAEERRAQAEQQDEQRAKQRRAQAIERWEQARKDNVKREGRELERALRADKTPIEGVTPADGDVPNGGTPDDGGTPDAPASYDAPEPSPRPKDRAIYAPRGKRSQSEESRKNRTVRRDAERKLKETLRNLRSAEEEEEKTPAPVPGKGTSVPSPPRTDNDNPTLQPLTGNESVPELEARVKALAALMQKQPAPEAPAPAAAEPAVIRDTETTVKGKKKALQHFGRAIDKIKEAIEDGKSGDDLINAAVDGLRTNKNSKKVNITNKAESYRDYRKFIAALDESDAVKDLLNQGIDAFLRQKEENSADPLRAGRKAGKARSEKAEQKKADRAREFLSRANPTVEPLPDVLQLTDESYRLEKSAIEEIYSSGKKVQGIDKAVQIRKDFDLLSEEADKRKSKLDAAMEEAHKLDRALEALEALEEAGQNTSEGYEKIEKEDNAAWMKATELGYDYYRAKAAAEALGKYLAEEFVKLSSSERERYNERTSPTITAVATDNEGQALKAEQHYTYRRRIGAKNDEWTPEGRKAAEGVVRTLRNMWNGLKVTLADRPKSGAGGDTHRYMKNAEGVAVGEYDAKAGEIRLYPGARVQDVVHEFVHPLMDYARAEAKAGRRGLLDKIGGIIDEAPQGVKDEVRRLYGARPEAEVLEEIFTHEMGREGESVFAAAQATREGRAWYGKVWDAIKELWRGFATKMGWNKADIARIDGMPAEEAARHILAEMANGRNFGGLADGGEVRDALIGVEGAANLFKGDKRYDVWSLEDTMDAARERKLKSFDMPDGRRFFMGTDGEYRLEIKDVRRRSFDTFRNGMELKEIAAGRDFFKAYPEAEKLKVVIDRGLVGTREAGYYNGDRIAFRPDQFEKAGGRIRLTQNGEKTLIHELQHYVQTVEGFSYPTEASAGKITESNYTRQAHEAEALAVEERSRFGSRSKDFGNVSPDETMQSLGLPERRKQITYNAVNRPAEEQGNNIDEDGLLRWRRGHIVAPATPAEVEREESSKPAQTFRNAAARAWQGLRERFLDNLLPLLQAEKSVQDAADSAAGRETLKGNAIRDKAASPYHAHFAEIGKTDEQMLQFEKNRQKPILEAAARMFANGVTEQDFNMYLVASHAKERNQMIRERGGGESGSGMTDRRANEILARFEANGKAAKMKPVAEKVWEMNAEARARMVADGRVLANEARMWARMSPHYVPLFEDDVTLRNAVHHAAGRTSIAQNVFLNSIYQARDAITRGTDLRFRAKLAEWVRAHPEVGHVTDTAPLVREVRRDASGELVVHEVQDPDYGSKEGVVQFYENGRRKYIVLNDGRVARAVRGLDMQRSDNLLMKALRVATPIYTALRTSLSPTFAAKNLASDTMEAAQNIGSELGAEAVKRFMKYQTGGTALRLARKAVRGEYDDSTQEGRWAREWAENGGRIGGMHQETLKELRERSGYIQREINRQLGRSNGKGAKAAAQWVNDQIVKLSGAIGNAINGPAETATRLAAYFTVRAGGGSVAEAVSYARNITVDFARKGNWTPVFNSLYAFSNANLQGLERASKSVLLGKFGRRVFTLVVMAGLAQAIVNGQNDSEESAKRGEPQWRDVNDWVKENALSIKAGDTRVSLPQRGLFKIGAYAGTLLGDWLVNGTETGASVSRKLAKSIASSVFDAVSPTSEVEQTIAPSIMRPLVELGSNKDFMGRPIWTETYGNQALVRSEHGKEKTSPFSKWLAKALNTLTGGNEHRRGWIDIPPEMIEHIASSIGGTVGRDIYQVAGLAGTVASGETPNVDDIPLVNRFVRRLPDNSARYFEAKRKLDAANEETKGQDKWTEEDRRDYHSRYPALRGMATRQMFTKLARDISKLRSLAQTAGTEQERDAARKMYLYAQEVFLRAMESGGATRETEAKQARSLVSTFLRGRK